jgi:hypothetical protein
VIVSGKNSYKSFVNMVDDEMERSYSDLGYGNKSFSRAVDHSLMPITTSPIRASYPKPFKGTIFDTVFGAQGPKDLAKRSAIYLWCKLPESVRLILKPRLKRLLGKG